MSVSLDSACVYRSRVMHRRTMDTAYRFHYRVFSLLMDIDAVDRVAASTRLFSRNRFNLLSFHDSDHLPPGADDMRTWVEGVLRDGGIAGTGLRIRLLCFPRVLGLVFNPLSLWYCETADGRPVAVVAEVRNTFGERHCYLLKPQPGATEWPLCAGHAKDFHVSPFIDMRARYEFRLARPGRRLQVLIREFAGDQLLLVATQHGERRAFNSRVLLGELLRVPLQTLKVVAAIHWQALRIWLAGARFYRKPEPPMNEVS